MSEADECAAQMDESVRQPMSALGEHVQNLCPTKAPNKKQISAARAASKLVNQVVQAARSGDTKAVHQAAQTLHERPDLATGLAAMLKLIGKAFVLEGASDSRVNQNSCACWH